MSEFHALLIEGVFFKGADGRVHAQTPKGVLSLDAELRPLLASNVHFAAHHLPIEGYPLPTDPSKRINIVAQGHLLLNDDGAYSVVQFNGQHVQFDPMSFIGQHARVLAATAMTVEQMREQVLKAGLQDVVEDLGQKAAQLRDVVEHVAKDGGE